jgi:murein tripeptide amidase MpaA
VAANAVGEKFNCMSYTVEMPFKDNVDVPDEIYGWSVQRSRQLGEDLLIAVNAVVKKLNG